MTAGVFVWSRRTEAARWRSFGSFLFPRRILSHASAILDYKFCAIDVLMRGIVYVPIITGVGAIGFKLMSTLLVGLCSWEPPDHLSPAQAVGAVFGLFLLHDFINYWGHVLFHKVPALWAFHQVHHSAEVLTPITAFRAHPIEQIVPAVLQMPVFGLGVVLFQNVSPGDLGIATIGGIGIFTVICNLVGFNLRHSHVWVSFGPVFNRLLISPAQHQIHHSMDPRHLNKNFGVKLAVWDTLFGTLYVPRERETLTVGLAGSAPHFQTVGQLYFRPFETALTKLNFISRATERSLDGRAIRA